MKPNEDMDVRELVSRCREHDDLAFAELIRRYAPMMRKLTQSFSDVGMDSEELYHEACVALHHAAMRYDLGQSDVTFGLYARICINHRMVDIARAAKRASVDIDTTPEAADEGSIESDILFRETFDMVMRSARDVLSDYEYKVLILHIQGYKTAEISRALGRPAKSVDNAKSRMFRRLRDSLGGISD